MAVVVNVQKFREKFAALGWDNVSADGIAQKLIDNNVTAPQLIAYLNALITTPEGLDDATIGPACPPAVATKLTNFFKTQGVAAV